jgi:hypothetical protein
MSVVCTSIGVYLMSVLRLNFYFWTPVIQTLYLCEKEWEDPWLFFEAKSPPRAKNILENTDIEYQLWKAKYVFQQQEWSICKCIVMEVLQC